MQIRSFKENITIVLLVASLIYIACVVFEKSYLVSQPQNLNAVKTDLLSNSELKPSVEKKANQENAKSAAPDASKKFDKFLGSPAEAAEVKSWYAKRGKFISVESDAEYLSYSQETLEKLAATDDIRAMQRLAELYLDRDHFEQYGFDAAKKQYWRAATYGSTEALINLAVIEKNTVYGLEKNDAAKKSDAIEVLAIYKAAELRGDIWSTDNQVPIFKEMEHITLSEVEQVAVDRRAQQIYDDLQRQRDLLDLGGFDNSMPESVKKFFDKVKMSK